MLVLGLALEIGPGADRDACCGDGISAVVAATAVLVWGGLRGGKGGINPNPPSPSSHAPYPDPYPYPAPKTDYAGFSAPLHLLPLLPFVPGTRRSSRNEDDEW